MSRRIQKRKLLFSQYKHGLLGEDRDSSGALQLMIVQKGILIVYPARLSDRAACI